MKYLVSDKVVAESDDFFARLDAKIGADPILREKYEEMRREAEKGIAKNKERHDLWIALLRAILNSIGIRM